MFRQTTFSNSYEDKMLKKKITKKKTYASILNEYSLKRNNFNPHHMSPNQFIKKLETRMKLYYTSCNKV
jgi:hypothetical protein